MNECEPAAIWTDKALGVGIFMVFLMGKKFFKLFDRFGGERNHRDFGSLPFSAILFPPGNASASGSVTNAFWLPRIAPVSLISRNRFATPTR